MTTGRVDLICQSYQIKNEDEYLNMNQETRLLLTARLNGYKKRFVLNLNGEWRLDLVVGTQTISNFGKVEQSLLQDLLMLFQKATSDDDQCIRNTRLVGIWQFELSIGDLVIQSECGPILPIGISSFQEIDELLMQKVNLGCVIFTDFPPLEPNGYN